MMSAKLINDLHQAVSDCANRNHPMNVEALANPETTVSSLNIPAPLWNQVLKVLNDIEKFDKDMRGKVTSQ
jgi:hypothetical protein